MFLHFCVALWHRTRTACCLPLAKRQLCGGLRMTRTVSFLGCCDTSSQSGGLKIAETDSLVWRPDIGNRGAGGAARLPESLGEKLLLPVQLVIRIHIPWLLQLVAASPRSGARSSQNLFFFYMVSLPLSLTRIFVMDLGSTRISQDDLVIASLI